VEYIGRYMEQLLIIVADVFFVTGTFASTPWFIGKVF